MLPASIQLVRIICFREPSFVARSGVAVWKGRIFIPPGGFDLRLSEALRCGEERSVQKRVDELSIAK
jgi:hypothetical protein